MRRFIPFLLLTLTLGIGGCLGYKELPVEYDYSYNGKFKKYRTFDLMQNKGGTTPYDSLKPIIESNIIARMKFLGYKQTEKKPNLLISYMVYKDSLNFKGYDQPDIELWADRPTLREDYKDKVVGMQSGTLLIQLYDRKQEKLIWNGYATNLYGSIDYENERQVRNAVISILDKYRFFADGYIEGKFNNGDEDIEEEDQ